MKRRWISTQQPDGDVAPCPAAAAGVVAWDEEGGC